MNYANDTRTLTMEELEEILYGVYGKEYADRGCYVDGRWLSVADILCYVSKHI